MYGSLHWLMSQEAPYGANIEHRSVAAGSHDAVPGPVSTATRLFARPSLIDLLESLGGPALDNLPFGLIGMAHNAIVELYNQTESRLSGLSPSRVIGRHLFTEVAPCTNNYMISYRFATEPELDDTINYVFTLRMAPTPVRLRLLKHPEARRMYLAVERR